MFVTSQVFMPAASGFIHVNNQYKKTLKHIPRFLQYSYIQNTSKQFYLVQREPLRLQLPHNFRLKDIFKIQL